MRSSSASVTPAVAAHFWVGQEVAGGADDFLGGDGGASADPAAGAGGGQALAAPWTMSSRMNSARAAKTAKTWKTRRPAGGGGVEVLVERGEADASLAWFGEEEFG
ncbi:hypothetical protein [Streptomyces sp. NPDC018833]|uniref:hypothetical protein n=1 Tax=Streptomyces sp. NPDC018833 TaxID=3365053 RepID=UPI0037A06A8A